jgi:gamma-glutamyl hercynylcysteine S-oxide synthase
VGFIVRVYSASMSSPIHQDSRALRHAGPADLARTWADTRGRLLRLFDAYAVALPPNLEIRYAPDLNPPLWELGHVGWFEEWWIARNPQRLRGVAADPDVARAAPLLVNADALYHSSRVAHATRWRLPLPDAARTRRYLEQVHERTRALLAQTADDDAAMYVYRLAHAHELMHMEAWIYMAQHLALDVSAALDHTQPAAAGTAGELTLVAQRVTLGHAGSGFAFDNELGAHEVEVDAFTIDRAAVTWAAYLPFVDAGGYDDEALWSPDGWDWRQRHSMGRPRYLIHDDGTWQRACFGRWLPLDTAGPAVNLSWHEAQAWCRWAGRRLPTEAEWECAAAAEDRFEWGQVWEWTASPFAPYPGFEPHPYRDYSMPWFDGRPVLRGASFATAPAMTYARYRNFFTADRNDIFAGFRSCAA